MKKPITTRITDIHPVKLVCSLVPLYHAISRGQMAWTLLSVIRCLTQTSVDYLRAATKDVCENSPFRQHYASRSNGPGVLRADTGCRKLPLDCCFCGTRRTLCARAQLWPPGRAPAFEQKGVDNEQMLNGQCGRSKCLLCDSASRTSSQVPSPFVCSVSASVLSGCTPKFVLHFVGHGRDKPGSVPPGRLEPMAQVQRQNNNGKIHGTVSCQELFQSSTAQKQAFQNHI